MWSMIEHYQAAVFNHYVEWRLPLEAAILSSRCGYSLYHILYVIAPHDDA